MNFHTHVNLLLGLGILLASVVVAAATTDSCAVVLNTPDGFLAFREGPGTRFRMKGKLHPGDIVVIATEECSWRSNIKCKRWMRVVADLDVLETADGQTSALGWVYSKYIQPYRGEC